MIPFITSVIPETFTIQQIFSDDGPADDLKFAVFLCELDGDIIGEVYVEEVRALYIYRREVVATQPSVRWGVTNPASFVFIP